jgi:hypothetical protein
MLFDVFMVKKTDPQLDRQDQARFFSEEWRDRQQFDQLRHW